MGSRAGVSGVQRGGVLGMRLFCNGHRPLSIAHTVDGSCDVRTEEPLLSCAWVRRSVTEVLKLVSDDEDIAARGGGEYGYEKQLKISAICTGLELSWDIESPRCAITNMMQPTCLQPTCLREDCTTWLHLTGSRCRWLLSFSTVNDAKLSYIAFSMDMPTVPAMLCIASGERCEPEAETVYFSHLAGQTPRQGQV